MPVITIKIGETDPKTKIQLIEKLTKTASEVTSIPESSFTIYIEEYNLENIGIGGQSLSEKMKNK